MLLATAFGVLPAHAQDAMAPAQGPSSDEASMTSECPGGAQGVAPAETAASPTKRAGHGRAEKDAPGPVDFHASPFPVDPASRIPGSGECFFSRDDGGLFHVSPRGGKLYQTPTYADRRSLVVVPARFDPAKPAALVVFFHGNLATLARDVVRRQKVVEQFLRSGLNAVLVAPQLAVDALDSSPGRFYQAGFLDQYLAEAASHAAERTEGRVSAETMDRLPVILVAYSGGYLATAFSLPMQSRTTRHIAGVVLLDALFGEEPKFSAWIAASHRNAFFVSAYSPSSAALNATLAADLATRGVATAPDLPPALGDGDVVLLSAPSAVHNDFVTAGWTRNPLEAVLKRVAAGLGLTQQSRD